MNTSNGVRPLSLATSIAIAALAVGLAGCAAPRTTQEKTAGWSNNRIYSEAREERNSGGYDRAVELYNVLEGRAAGTTARAIPIAASKMPYPDCFFLLNFALLPCSAQ